ncbi:protoporphyrinogen oxidase [Coraliomargarita sinensis]|uniref:Coproporphyrinogen III oxidase n=1 Tax=Coraliomargarita sinensis TaxID=2174842 RepID=A0A317ZK12_9BACT|nr:protoporphyrinogen oxidase [Coraliomargarita sinensis]PXA04573.1 protoporphyrinogen oxidase [Coraliomargarita sinensis]
MKRICIIGSGITALATAWQRTRDGDACTVLESSPQIGGAIQSHRQGDYLAEEGPNSIQINSREVDDFLASIPGLEERITEANPAAQKRYIVRRGKLHAVPMNPWQAITTRLWSLGGRMRVLKEPFIRSADPDSEQSAADFVRRRLGEELYQYAINPLIGGIYAGDPEQLSLRYAFPKLHALEQNHGGLIRGSIAKMREAKRSTAPKVNKRIISFKDGLGELPQLLASALKDACHINVSIESIQRGDQKWSVEWNGESQSFDELIVTLPAHALHKLPFPKNVREAFEPLATIDYPPVSVLSLAFKRSDVSHPLDGFGALVPECENRNILGVLFPSTLFDGRAPEDEVLLTAFVGGERQPELATNDTEQVKGIVLDELRELLGVRSEPTFVHHRHWPKAIPQYKIGYGSTLDHIEKVEKDYPGLKLAGNYRTGISLSYCIESSVQADR